MQTYLLHLSEPYPRGKHPAHYLGWAVSPRDRLKDHQTGGWAAAALTRAAAAEGITMQIVRVWDGGPRTEKPPRSAPLSRPPAARPRRSD
jgi:hypothetical protein